MNKAIIYAKARTSFGIRRQLKTARRYAIKHGLDVIGTHADFDLLTVDTNSQPELMCLQHRAAEKNFQYLLVRRKTIISKDIERLIATESYLDRLGIKIVSVSKREL